MKKKVTIALDGELLSFLDAQARGNRSEYINALLEKQRRQQLESELVDALKQDLADPNYLDEVVEWDFVAGDGIDAAG